MIRYAKIIAIGMLAFVLSGCGSSAPKMTYPTAPPNPASLQPTSAPTPAPNR